MRYAGSVSDPVVDEQAKVWQSDYQKDWRIYSDEVELANWTIKKLPFVEVCNPNTICEIRRYARP